MKKETFSNLAIATGLGLIFGVAIHKWSLGLIIGILYFLVSVLILKRKK